MQRLKLQQMPLKIIIIAIIIVTLNINMFAYVWCNSSETCFDESGQGSGKAVNRTSRIGLLVSEGAGYLIHAYAKTLQLLSLVEAGPINPAQALEEVLEWSVSDLGNAKQCLNRLILKADKTPYNTGVMWKLAFFDYNGYARIHDEMNPRVWNIAVKYLRNGDIRGIYRTLLKQTENLHHLLLKVSQDIRLQGFPEIQALWKLNQHFSNTLLLGQYVAQVFSRLDRFTYDGRSYGTWNRLPGL